MKYSIIIASAPDRDNIVAEIWQKDYMIAEVSHENKAYGIEIYATDRSIKLDYLSFTEVLAKAKEMLPY